VAGAVEDIIRRALCPDGGMNQKLAIVTKGFSASRLIAKALRGLQYWPNIQVVSEPGR
jgi:hypothetical protein